MKRLLKIVIGLILVLVLAIAAVLFLLDPNMFKPRIQALAEQQGVHLAMDGDLSWRFWPSVGIELNDIAVASLDEPGKPIARLASASLMVATAPLFSGELVVESLLVNGASVDLVVDSTGAGNWEALAAANGAESEAAAPVGSEIESAATESTEGTGSTGAIKLAIDAIDITDVSFNYRDQQTGTELAANVDALRLLQFNLENRPFDFSLDASVALTDPASFPQGPVSVAISLNARMTLDEALNQFDLASSELIANISSATGKSDMAVTFDMSARELQGDLNYQGELVIKPINVKAVLTSLGQTVPVTANENAMTAIGFSADVVGSANTAALDNVTISLDETTFKGKLAVTDINAQAVEFVLAGDKINVDDYLPPVVDGEVTDKPTSGEPPVSKAEPAPEEPLPLEALRSLDLLVDLSLQQAIVSKLKLTNIKLTASAKDGLLQLTDMSLDTYQGRLESTASLDARGPQAKAMFKADMAGLELAPMLKDMELDESVQLTGALNFAASGNTSGLYASELTEKLSADANFAGKDVVFAPVNVEEYFCKAVALAKDEKESEDGKTSEDRQWPEKTPMRALEGTVTIRDQVVQVENFSAGVEHLILSTLGSVNLGEQKYDFRLPMTLLEESTSEIGCTVKSNYWINRSLSLLRCKGSLANLSPVKDCGLDSDALKSLVSDYAQYRVQKELVRQLGGDNKDGENAGEQSDTEKAVEGLLKGLFNQDKK
ncbi:AsmA family protein [Gilvimarinus sp. SDUM040013]|uniref:AsmA family protein n=1 Tax=Gilvimarinus gilvus TaxID=3058038 RepID=A0ABU4RUY2_9GAMM|nr:AsmA family protein [Gilvimarinus sp. SDUM040013]MDO3387947.1 AsmA family protein [Gilvimarinus sp. SDUM040013]MDX6848682.1 AsmA family protein [Gilvimarinus sp. SDUM040013]